MYPRQGQHATVQHWKVTILMSNIVCEVLVSAAEGYQTIIPQY